MSAAHPSAGEGVDFRREVLGQVLIVMHRESAKMFVEKAHGTIPAAVFQNDFGRKPAEFIFRPFFGGAGAASAKVDHRILRWISREAVVKWRLKGVSIPSREQLWLRLSTRSRFPSCSGGRCEKGIQAEFRGWAMLSPQEPRPGRSDQP